MSSELTKIEAHTIRSMRRQGMPITDIAYVLERSIASVERVLTGKRAQRDDRADGHDRLIGPTSSGCYDGDEEIPIFEDPTMDAAIESEMTGGGAFFGDEMVCGNTLIDKEFTK